MNSPRCPIAGPFVWSVGRDSACTAAAFLAAVPANDFSPVSPRSPAAGGLPIGKALGRSAGVAECRGVVISCPLGRPLLWSSSNRLSLPPATPVPAKEKKKRVQPGTATGGGP
jgi:hypothetical protein